MLLRNVLVAFIVSLVLLTAPLLVNAQDAQILLQQAEAVYMKRSASMQNAYAAIKLYELAATADPGLDVPHYQIARAYYFIGRFSPQAQREALYLKGVEAAKKALAANPNSAGGHYWYSACMARAIEDKSIITKSKYVNDIKGHMLAAIKSDPRFYHGGPARALGMVSFKSPFGNNSDAIQLLRESLKHDSDYSLTLVNLAEVLIKEKQYEEARQLCHKVLALKPEPGFARELKGDQQLAQRLLNSIPQ